MVLQAPKKAIGLQLPIGLGSQGYFATNTTTISQISSNINNLLLTRPGERRFNNEFGSSLYNLLFDNIGFELTKEILVDTVQRDLDKFIGGITVTNVELKSEETLGNDKNTIFISVTFTYNNTVATTTISLSNTTL
jgi:phage baseplate assembly protein W